MAAATVHAHSLGPGRDPAGWGQDSGDKGPSTFPDRDWAWFLLCVSGKGFMSVICWDVWLSWGQKAPPWQNPWVRWGQKRQWVRHESPGLSLSPGEEEVTESRLGMVSAVPQHGVLEMPLLLLFLAKWKVHFCLCPPKNWYLLLSRGSWGEKMLPLPPALAWYL